MATTMYNRSSNVEEFLKSHRSRLNEDKMRMKEEKSFGMSGGILPSDEGRSQSIQQRKNERQLEYQKYLQDYESNTSGRNMKSLNRPPSNSISEIRKQMQKEREKEITFGTDHYSKTGGTDLDTPTIERTERNTQPLLGLGGIGYKVEESPEEKRQRQSKYREELIKQMKEKTSRKMGSTKLFEEEDRKPARQHKQPSPPVNHRESNRIKFDFSDHEDKNNGNYDEDIREKIKFDHNQYRPSQYHREYPYYPPPPPGVHPSLGTHPLPPPLESHPPPPFLGSHPPPPPPGSHYSYSPYYFPTHYPHMYPPPSHQPPYYHPYDNNPYTNRYGGRATPTTSHHSHSPPSSPPQQSFTYKSTRTSTLSNKSSKQHMDKTTMGQTDSRSEFRAFLDQQVKEKKEREAKERREIDKMYRKIDAEAEVYDPWGKPGGGAPLTDAIGNVVTERGQLRKSYDDNISPRMSEEDRKKLVQEKTKRELEEQIKENKERQIREKYEKQRMDEEEDKKIKEDLKRMNIKERHEIDEERKKKQLEDQEKQKKVVIEEQSLSARELAELRFKEDLEKRKKKEKEEKERLDRLADKMASDSTPAWRQRNPSPPIPALQKNKRASDIPPYQQPTNARVPSPPIQPPYQQPANVRVPSPPIQPPYQQPTNARVQLPNTRVQLPLAPAENHIQDDDHIDRQPKTLSNQEDNTHITPQNQHSTYQSPFVPDGTNNQFGAVSRSKPNSRPSSLRDDNNVTGVNNHSLSATPRNLYRQPSQELLQNFSALKNQIRRTVSSTGGEAPPFLRRQSQPVPSLLKNDTKFVTEPTLNIGTHDSNEATRPRISSGLSNFTIATMQIDSLANRNQERARRLDEIMNSSNRTGSQNSPRDILTEFLHRRNE